IGTIIFKEIGHMKLDQNQCGTSRAFADTCGNPISAAPVILDSATSSRSAGQIIPAYLKTEQTALVGFVHQYLSFLRTTSLNRIIKAIEKPQNKLFDRLFPEILNADAQSYICLSSDVFAKGKSQRQIESAISREIGPSQLQEVFP